MAIMGKGLDIEVLTKDARTVAYGRGALVSAFRHCHFPFCMLTTLNVGQ